MSFFFCGGTARFALTLGRGTNVCNNVDVDVFVFSAESAKCGEEVILFIT